MKVSIALLGLVDYEEYDQNHRWETLLNSCQIVDLRVGETFFRQKTIDMSSCWRKETKLGEALLNMTSLEVLDMTACKIYGGGLSRMLGFINVFISENNNGNGRYKKWR